MAIEYNLHELNRLSWNQATLAHNSHKENQVDFFRAGGQTLFPEECELLGDIKGKNLVHLQCNSGQDTLSLAKLGASVTGVDISDEAILFAKNLSEKSQIHALFFREDIYKWLKHQPNNLYDISFCSYGAIGWLSDLNEWAKNIYRILKPNGRLVIMEFHPLLFCFDENWQLNDSYFYLGSIEDKEGINDYVELSKTGLVFGKYNEGVKNFNNPHPCYYFQRTVADLITSLIHAGFHLRIFKEYPYSNGYKPCDNMREEGRRMYLPNGMQTIPLMYGLVVEKN